MKRTAFHSSLLSLASCSLLVASCGGLGGGGGNDGPGGKADDPASCDDPDRNCLDFTSYEVLFTNPVCTELGYSEPVDTAGGEGQRLTKPKNVYCTRDDAAASAARENAPEKRILDWIEPLDEGDEVFLAFLSYSNRTVGDALCRAAERGVKVTFVLDKPSARGDELMACGGEVLLRGHVGSIGFAHIKTIMVNPNLAGPADDNEQFMKISFGSGNMSSGTVLHHENWHFIEANRDSFFVESHRCMMEALIDPALTDGKTPWRKFMNECRAEIPFAPEDDIKPFFIPVNEDNKAITALMEAGVADATTVDIAAHRFSWRQMVDSLVDRLSGDEDFKVRLVADDDLYWLRPLVGAAKQTGPNDFFELDRLDQIRDAGGDQFEDRYLETNHSLFLLQHNKFMIFNGIVGRPDAVLTGSPNLTGAGFSDNLENVYWIEIPLVLDAYRRQFDKFWDNEQPNNDNQVAPQATRPEDMPAVDITLNIDDAVEPGRGGEGVIFNEVLADPAPGFDADKDGIASTSDDEFVEIVNIGDTAMDLSGAQLSDALRERVVIPNGVVIPPRGALVIFAAANTDADDFPGATILAAGRTLSLNNTGDTITLTSAGGEVLATMTYGSSTDQSLTREVDGDEESQLVPHTGISGGAIASPGTRADGSAF